MNGCDEHSAYIPLYLDKELSGPDLEAFSSHLKTCHACASELQAEEKLSSLIRQSRPHYFASDDLRTRVIQATTKSLPVAEHASTGLWTRISGRSSQPFLFPGWMTAAAILLVIVASGLLMPRLLQRSRAVSYVEAALAAHSGFLDGSLPLEIQSDSPNLITAWFTGKVPFHFRLPVAVPTSGQDPQYKLVGGRLVNYKGGYAALVAYQMQKEKISLIIAPDQSALSAGGEEIRSGGLVFHYNKRAGFNIITWTNHGLTYALVSSLPGSGRQSCLICHQSMADGNHFIGRQ